MFILSILSNYIFSLITFFILIVMFVNQSYFKNIFRINYLKPNIHNGVQNISQFEAPRITGLAFFISFVVFSFENYSNLYIELILLSFFLFAISIIEDIKHNTSPRLRFFIILFSCLSAIYFLDINPEFDVIFFSNINDIYFFSLLFFSICLTTYVNGSNIIDGSNGTLAICFLSSLLSILSIMIIINFLPHAIVLLISFLICTLVLFLIFNYPSGKIFMGDSSAYFVSFLIGIILLYVMTANVDKLNPFTAVLILFYPSIEVIFSLLRKYFYDKVNPLLPDQYHLHLMLYFLVNDYLKNSKLSNNLIMPSLSVFIIIPPALSIFLYDQIYQSIMITCVFTISYLITYIITRIKFEKSNITF